MDVSLFKQKLFVQMFKVLAFKNLSMSKYTFEVYAPHTV